MNVDVILGLQWGDEGKGKIVDHLAKEYDVVARFQGGPNAGHTLKINNQKFVLHTIPSGIFRPRLTNLIGNGVVIDPVTLEKEIAKLDEAEVDYQGRLIVAHKAHLILPTHRYLDAASENAKGKAKIGSTLKGIGPTYMDKTGRNGLRAGDIISTNFDKKYQALKEKHLKLLEQYPPIDFDLEAEEAKWMDSLDRFRQLPQVSGEYFINQALAQGKKVLAEGAQGSMLDIDYGTYPFVTSSNTITAGVCTGLGISTRKIGEVIGISKAYCTRVGSGPFPTELHDEVGELLRKEGAEFGATTGRPRRCGWIDLPQLKYTIMLNGVSQLVITKIDVLNVFKEIMMATHYAIDGEKTDQLPYDLCDVEIEPVLEGFKGWESSLEDVLDYEELPAQAKVFIKALENYLEVPVTMVSTGPARQELIQRNISANV
jgi:adenylosuccinate synthase